MSTPISFNTDDPSYGSTVDTRYPPPGAASDAAAIGAINKAYAALGGNTSRSVDKSVQAKKTPAEAPAGSPPTAAPVSSKYPAPASSGMPPSIKSILPETADNRLFTSIPRSAAAVTEYYRNSVDPPGYLSDRGPIASIRWLTAKKDLSVIASKVNRYAPGGTLQDDLNLLTTSFNHFFLTGSSANYSEKTQIHSTFGDNEIVYFFGRQPVVFDLEGILFDTIVEDWFSKFVTLYWAYLRGTQLARYFELVEITLPNMRIKGSIISLSHAQDSSSDQLVRFRMQFLAKEFVPISIPDTDTLEILANMSKYTPISFEASKLGIKKISADKGEKGVKYSAGTKTNKPTYTSVASVVRDSPAASASAAMQNISNSIEAFTSSIFSPVFGIITSIAKVVTVATGTVSAAMKAVTTPISNLLATVRRVDNQVQQLVGLIEKDVADLVSIPTRLMADLNHTLKDLKNTAGMIARMPETIAQTIQRSITSGIQSGHSAKAVLSSGKKRVKSKSAILQSGHKYIPAKSYTL
jgi:hypothetical protein